MPSVYIIQQTTSLSPLLNSISGKVLRAVSFLIYHFSAGPGWSCAKAVYKRVWHIPLLSVQLINSWRWTEELSETCRVSCQNKLLKLVHLVGFIIKKSLPEISGERNGITCKGLNVSDVSTIGYETSTLRPLHYLEKSRKDYPVTQLRISKNGNPIFI